MLHPALCFYCGAWSPCELYKCPRCGCRSGLVCSTTPLKNAARAFTDDEIRRAVRVYLIGGPDRRFSVRARPI